MNARFLFFTCVAVGALFGSPSQLVGQGKKVTVTLEHSGNTYQVFAHNKNPYSVTINLSASGKNYKATVPMPVVKVVSPYSNKSMLSIYRDDSTKSYKFDTHYAWYMGNVNARHDNSYAYRLPFRRGKSVKVGQGFGGSFSHTGSAKYAIDFTMDQGTPVYAARGGMVAEIKEDSDVGGNSISYKDDANYILIEHSDGTLGEYAHLRKNGVIVNEGDAIERGQLIGYSGNTGYSSGPHLHFMVVKVSDDGVFHSLPVSFYTKRGALRELKEGKTYTAY